MSTLKHVAIEAKKVDGFKIELKARDHVVLIDQPKGMGGTDSGPTPLEYQLFALAGCIGAIAQIMANQKRINLKGFEIKVEGDLDTDVLMGKGNGSRAGFQEMKIIVKFDADMTEEEKKAFLEEIDARCPISNNIQETTPIVFEVIDK